MSEPVILDDPSQLNLEAYQKEGYLVIENLLDSSSLRGLKGEVMDLMDQLGLKESKLRQTNRFLRGGCIENLVRSPRLKALAAHLMEGAAHLYLPFTAVKTAGGGGAFDYHQDNQYTRHRGGWSINLWVALVDMTVENGCLYVDPRSHTQGTLEAEILEDGHRKVDPKAPVPVEIKAGSCVAFHRLLVHGSTINQSSEHRLAYAVQYHREDTEALMDGEWRLLKDNPVYRSEPLESLDQLVS